jgi:hypothetical protein
VTKIEIGLIAADMFGLDDVNTVDESYLQFMSTLFNPRDLIRFQVSFNTFKLQNFKTYVSI